MEKKWEVLLAVISIAWGVVYLTKWQANTNTSCGAAGYCKTNETGHDACGSASCSEGECVAFTRFGMDTTCVSKLTFQNGLPDYIFGITPLSMGTVDLVQLAMREATNENPFPLIVALATLSGGGIITLLSTKDNPGWGWACEKGKPCSGYNWNLENLTENTTNYCFLTQCSKNDCIYVTEDSDFQCVAQDPSHFWLWFGLAFLPGVFALGVLWVSFCLCRGRRETEDLATELLQAMEAQRSQGGEASRVELAHV